MTEIWGLTKAGYDRTAETNRRVHGAAPDSRQESSRSRDAGDVEYWGKLTSALSAPTNGFTSPTTCTVRIWIRDPDAPNTFKDPGWPDVTVVNRNEGLTGTIGTVCRIANKFGEWIFLMPTGSGCAGQNCIQQISCFGKPTGGTWTLKLPSLVVGANTTQAGTWTSGSTSITLSASNSSIAVGMGVSGTGVPTGATVSGISGTALTISAATTAGGTGATLTFTAIPGVTLTLDYDCTADDIETGLAAYPSLGADPVNVTGGPFPTANLSIEFTNNYGNKKIFPPLLDWSNLTGGTGVGMIALVLAEGR